MASRGCPVCGTTVKLENLARHLANVHPRENPSVVLSEEERRQIRRGARRSIPPLRVRRSTVVMAAVASLAVVGVVVGLPYLPSLPSGGTGFHWHTNLSVIIDRQAIAIPPNIGIDPALWNDHTLDDYGSMHDMPEMGMAGMAPLHTHNPDGRIHIESRVTRDYTIGEFFRIWGQSFDSQQALGHAATSGHRVWMVVDGSTMSPSYSVVLQDEMQIQVVCGVG